LANHAVVKALRESYDYGAKVWAGLTEEKALEMIEVRGQKVQRWSAILGAIQDNMNHYGNLVVYVRLNGLVPPRRPWRERAVELFNLAEDPAEKTNLAGKNPQNVRRFGSGSRRWRAKPSRP
jgi:hypothetical protein